MVGLDVPSSELIVTTVALAIVVTLGVQTTMKTWLGRRLGLDKRYWSRTWGSTMCARIDLTVSAAAAKRPPSGMCARLKSALADFSLR
jgi:hypothetical protein